MRFLIGSMLFVLVCVDSLAGQPEGLEAEILADQIRGQAALINDRQELEKVAKSGESSALALIGEDNIQSFVESAVFTEFGLASLDSQFLEGLSVTDAYRFLQLFGWESYTLSFSEVLRVSSDLDRDLLAQLPEHDVEMCPPEQPRGVATASSGSEPENSTQCYDPRCILHNRQCTAGCMPWNGAACNICRC